MPPGNTWKLEQYFGWSRVFRDEEIDLGVEFQLPETIPISECWEAKKVGAIKGSKNNSRSVLCSGCNFPDKVVNLTFYLKAVFYFGHINWLGYILIE